MRGDPSCLPPPGSIVLGTAFQGHPANSAVEFDYVASGAEEPCTAAAYESALGDVCDVCVTDKWRIKNTGRRDCVFYVSDDLGTGFLILLTKT